MNAELDATAAAPEGGEQPKTAVKVVNLALQGGGSHGAFAWGALDYLLEDGRLGFEGISATSAGAVNAVVCASGMLKGGREGARRALADFWRAVADAGAAYRAESASWFAAFSGLARYQYAQMQSLLATSDAASSPPLAGLLDLNPFFRLFAGTAVVKPKPSPRNFVRAMFDALSSIFSPYTFNAANVNPLKDLLAAHVDFAALQATQDATKLHICATNVETGKIRIFKNRELTVEAVLASTCFPFLFQAIEIEGAFYWDGGYIGNPAIFPLIYETQSCDVVIIHIDPIIRQGCPKTMVEIMNRHSEIAFNSSLMREMRAIAFVNQLLETGKVQDDAMKLMRMHAIRAEAATAQLGALTKADTDWNFLQMLFLSGREAAAEWLDRNYQRIGRESTVNVETDYL
jgi:NTE family protein